MSSAIVNLKPEAVWRQFAAISAIPRCSKKEEAVRRYVIAEAERNGLAYRTDTVGNIAVTRPGGESSRRQTPVVLQGHLDMVCEKNMATSHDFSNDPIRLVREGDWLRADNTTLGADNGIAVAMMLAVMEHDDEALGPVQCLFTVDEETGLTGALGLDPTMIEGRRLINLDSEEEGFFCIGCAGGKNTYGTLPLVWHEGDDNAATGPAGGSVVEITLTGLSGGHSGAEIHLERGNSVVLGGRLLATLRTVSPGIRIAEISGGDKHNAIPREFRATLIVPGGDRHTVESAVQEAVTVFREELSTRDPGLEATIVELDRYSRALSVQDTARIVDLLVSLPHGVLGMSAEVPGLVETSTNLAAVRIESGALQILTSQRSSRGSRIDAAAEHVAACIRLAGGDVRFGEGYPAWPPRPESPLVDTAVAVFRRRFQRDPEVGAFHAGLECGVIGDKVGDMDMISFGPDMEGVHTPDERISVSSTERTWGLLLELLREIV